jgi:CRP-like cAMP-binding protein
MHASIHPLTNNELLRSLSRRDHDALKPYLERVPLKANRVLHHGRAPMEYVYFLEEGLVSVLAEVGGGDLIEVWLVGREGMVGTPAILGVMTSRHRRIVHLGGSAFRLRCEDLAKVMDEVPSVRARFLQYAYLVLLQTSQIGACNAKHQVEQRLARWILMADDRCDADKLPLTQQTLSRMLGVRRATVTQCIASLERRGFIATARGSLGIVERQGLESTACPCYGIVRNQYVQLMGSTQADVIWEGRHAAAPPPLQARAPQA